MFLSSVKEIFNLRQKIVSNLNFSLPEVSIKRSKGLEIGVKRSISVVATCLNEEQNIEQWLHALLEQTLIPDEVVVCDGGSQDATLELLKKWKHEHPKLKVTLVTSDGANIAKGRNEAVKNSFGEILLFSDVGTLPDQEWVRELALPFLSDKLANVSLGRSESIATTELSNAISKLILQDESEIVPERFLASGRSIGVTREVFKKVGGFPEELTLAGEDTLFNLKLRENYQDGFYYSPNAIANWLPPKNFGQLWKMLFRYAKGDAQSGVFYKDYLSRITELSAILLGAGLSCYTIYYAIRRAQYGVFLITLVSLYFALSPLIAYQAKLKKFLLKEKILAPLVLISSQALGFICGLLLSGPGGTGEKR